MKNLGLSISHVSYTGNVHSVYAFLRLKRWFIMLALISYFLYLIFPYVLVKWEQMRMASSCLKIIHQFQFDFGFGALLRLSSLLGCTQPQRSRCCFHNRDTILQLIFCSVGRRMQKMLVIETEIDSRLIIYFAIKMKINLKILNR